MTGGGDIGENVKARESSFKDDLDKIDDCSDFTSNEISRRCTRRVKRATIKNSSPSLATSQFPEKSSLKQQRPLACQSVPGSFTNSADLKVTFLQIFLDNQTTNCIGSLF